MVKMSQKRTCEGCKALDQRQYINDCLLGYKFDEHFKPLEICPKPKTYEQYIESKQWYDNR
jgi:hypothetical protein